MSRMLENIKKIEAYEKNNTILQKCHHFLYDLPLIKHGAESKNIVLMGFNPGETKDDWKVTEGKRTQETSQFDFLSFYNKRKNNKWSKSVKDMLGEFNIVQTELFFWSSPNVKTLHDRIDNLFNSEEMQFCTRMNYDLFDHYRPSCIVFTGISHAKFVEETFELIKVHEEKSDKGRLFIEYKDKNSTPWMVTKHFTGSFGFKNSDKEIIRNRVSQLVNAAD